jgi:hypothetical protein
MHVKNKIKDNLQRQISTKKLPVENLKGRSRTPQINRLKREENTLKKTS